METLRWKRKKKRRGIKIQYIAGGLRPSSYTSLKWQVDVKLIQCFVHLSYSVCKRWLMLTGDLYSYNWFERNLHVIRQTDENRTVLTPHYIFKLILSVCGIYAFTITVCFFFSFLLRMYSLRVVFHNRFTFTLTHQSWFWVVVWVSMASVVRLINRYWFECCQVLFVQRSEAAEWNQFLSPHLHSLIHSSSETVHFSPRLFSYMF